VRGREHAAAATSGDRLRGLDEHLELTTHLGSGEHDEAVQAQQLGGQVVRAVVGTVIHAWGLPEIRMLGRFGS
jgi:hypothetical protein